MLKSPKTKILADGLIERTSSMLDEIESKTVHKEEGDQLRKKQGEWPSGLRGLLSESEGFQFKPHYVLSWA